MFSSLSFFINLNKIECNGYKEKAFKKLFWMCEWSFRRFTYGNRVTTFASFRGLYLRNFPTNTQKGVGQSIEFTGPSDRLQRRAVCTKGRDVIGASCWLTPTRHSSLKINNCNNLSPSRCTLKRLPRPSGQGQELVACISVARVQPRTSKGITDLLLPQTSLR